MVKKGLEALSQQENVLLGVVCGSASKSVNYPLLVFKNYAQQGLGMPSLYPWMLYRGLPMAMLNLGGTTALQFWFTGIFQKRIRQISDNDGVVQMAGSFLGGLASGIPCSIWELIMVYQMRFGGSIISVPTKIIREHGISGGLLRGLTMTLGRESVFTLSMLGITPAIQDQVVHASGLDKNTALAAGSLAGAIFSATITHPLDTVKTCLQGDVARLKYKTNTQTFSLLYQEAGSISGLFKGLNWRIVLIATTFFLVNDFKARFAPLLFPRLAALENSNTKPPPAKKVD